MLAPANLTLRIACLLWPETLPLPGQQPASQKPSVVLFWGSMLQRFFLVLRLPFFGLVPRQSEPTHIGGVLIWPHAQIPTKLLIMPTRQQARPGKRRAGSSARQKPVRPLVALRFSGKEVQTDFPIWQLGILCWGIPFLAQGNDLGVGSAPRESPCSRPLPGFGLAMTYGTALSYAIEPRAAPRQADKTCWRTAEGGHDPLGRTKFGHW